MNVQKIWLVRVIKDLHDHYSLNGNYSVSWAAVRIQADLFAHRRFETLIGSAMYFVVRKTIEIMKGVK